MLLSGRGEKPPWDENLCTGPADPTVFCVFTGTGAEGFLRELRNTAALTGPLRALPGVFSPLGLELELALPGMGLAADSAKGETRAPGVLAPEVSMLRLPCDSLRLLFALLLTLLAHLEGTTAEGKRGGGTEVSGAAGSF